MIEIELTDPQRLALHAEQGMPVDVVDPATQRRYVLLAQEQFERVRPFLGPSLPVRSEPDPPIDPTVLRSMQAYWQELPVLCKLQSKTRRWVAYQRDEQIGFGKTRTELYQECFRRGLQRGEFYIGKLAADPEGIPPWGSREGDWSLYEVQEEGEAGHSTIGE